MLAFTRGNHPGGVLESTSIGNVVFIIGAILALTVRADQMVLSQSNRKLELSKEWDVLGPFPIHAREQHFLEPSFPIDVNLPIDYSATYPSSYADGGQVSWSKAHTHADADGDSGSQVLEVSFPDTVRWKALRDTEGWAALQHHAVLRTTLTVYPGTSPSPPDLFVNLVGGSHFSILPTPTTEAEARSKKEKGPVRWYAGNIYDMERALPHAVELPTVPFLTKSTTYDVFVSGDFEVRLFGDPRVRHASETPVQTIKFSAQFDESDTEEEVVWEPTQDVIPDAVSGWMFGEAIGIGLRSRGRWWSIRSIQLAEELAEYLSIDLTSSKFRLAPTQACILPLRVTQRNSLPQDRTALDLTLSFTLEDPESSHRDALKDPGMNTKRTHAEESSETTLILHVSLPISHLPMWDTASTSSSTNSDTNTNTNPGIKASYFFGSGTMPTNFLLVPPRFAGEGKSPILALHGAGVDIFSPTPTESFWAQSLPRQDRSWIVTPSGRTAWGLDWHGPSAQDAWKALDAAVAILAASASPSADESNPTQAQAPWGRGQWAIPCVPGQKPKAIVMGHSNGGQGAWHIAERFPDRALGVIPASAYIKSQSYVPWTMSRSAHFVDPFLDAILKTSLTPDDNDLFLSNLHGKDVLAIHGGDDENVPVWHSRELVGVLQSITNANRGINASSPRVEYQEIPGKTHWFPSVLNNSDVQSFIDAILAKEANSNAHDTSHDNKLERREESFKLTVAIPAESGSMKGWHVERLTIPGRLGHVSVDVTTKHESNPKGAQSATQRVVVETTNVRGFSVDLKTFGVLDGETELWIDGEKLHVDSKEGEGQVLSFQAVEPRVWKISKQPNTLQLSGRMQTILSSRGSEGEPAPLVLVVPDPALDPESTSPSGTSHTMSIALRLAHDLLLFHRLDSQIVLNSEVNLSFSGNGGGATSVLGRGNVVVIGNEAALELKSALSNLDGARSAFLSTEEFLAKVHVDKVRTFGPDGPTLRPELGLVFLHPHPLNSHGKMLLLQSTDASGKGLERATRLFPIRTGIPVPDWIIVGTDEGRGEGDVFAAGLWDSEWDWNEDMSWSSVI